jgi:aryl-alcohol dehydrogenase-like predicted oxidoreductase
VAYSGENEALDFALGHPAIAAVQLSVNLLDQRGLREAVPRAVERGVGVIAKRPLASAAWRRETAEAAYAERMAVLGDALPGEADWPVTSLRFAAYAPGVDCCLLGTRRLEHLDAALAALALGPLPDDTVLAVTRAFAGAGRAWGGLV